MLVNAMGIEQTIKIASIADVNRGFSAWTTGWANVNLIGDLIVCQIVQCSLVRGSPSHPDQLGLDWDRDIYNGDKETVVSELIRQKLGPFTAIDIRFIHPPLSLVALFTAFDATFNAPPLNLPNDVYTVDAVPTAWSSNDFVFYGGNPLCPLGLPQPYVQHSFGYYDDCGSQDPHTIDLSSRCVAFAILASKLRPSDVPATCLACMKTSGVCSKVLSTAFSAITNSLPPDLVDQATRDLKVLHLTMIQMATNVTAGTDTILSQEMIGDGDPWSVFGWVAIWEWMDGQREVFVFEGDEGSWTIISRSYGYLQLPANRLALPQVACKYIRLLTIYVSIVLSALALVLFVFAFHSGFDVDGMNLFFFNRVVGSVWIGRPLLFLRGMTAISVLSTSSVAFNQIGGTATVSANRRSIVEIFLFAGESTWLVYVLNDLFLPLTTHLSSFSAPLSSVMAFIITSAIEISQPVQMAASISQTCSFKSLISGVVCTSGKISIGSFTRACVLVAVQLGCVIVTYGITRLVNKRLARPRVAAGMTQHVAIPAAADAFFAAVRGTTYNLDNVACVMSGIIPAAGCVLDVKLWTLFEATKSKRASGVVLRRCSLGTKRAVVGILPTSSPKRIQRVWSILGFVYMGLSIAGSYAFLRLIEATMTNDFWWAKFDLNNTQSYLCNWFNLHLITKLIDGATLHLNDIERVLLVTVENMTDPNVNIAPAYVNLMQDQINSLPSVISALRRMNGCDLPWIFTAYCFVDFDQTWELANSRARQDRCRRQHTTNGAVYLEALIRNNHEFTRCWNEALEISIFGALRESNAGLSWLDRISADQLTVENEVDFWHSHGIVSYVTQWQNFKSLGVFECMDVYNALGFAYPLTLKKSNGTLQLSRQTSYKMYWGLAGDLTAISTNGSTMHGQSLVRQAHNFAFHNRSLENELFANLTLQAPLSLGMTLLRAKLGPFGSVDMYRIPVPLSLLQLYSNLSQTLVSTLATSSSAQHEFWPLYTTSLISPRPSIWDNAFSWGGNVLCPEQSSPLPQALSYFSSQGLCAWSILEYIELTAETSFKALVASGLTYNMTRMTSIEKTCQRVAHLETCATSLYDMKTFTERHITSQGQMELAYAAAQQLKTLDLQLQLFQYISGNDSAIFMSTPGLFDDADFEFFGWIMLFEWVQGLREAVTFQGDVGALTLLSTKYYFTRTPADAMEVPLNLALYVHRIVQYFTFILLCVAIIVVHYIIHCRGYIQGLNLFSFNRVAGLVWLGRPLVFVRGVTAITLLSTASLELRRPHAGLVAFLDAPSVDPIKTFFSAGEATWLAYILNDVFSLVTCQHTSSYSLKSSLLLWAATATWSFVSPVAHSVDMNRVCSLVSVDSQAICRSGTVRIGSSDRFLGILLLAIVSCILCYVFERIRHRHVRSSDKSTSLFLYAAAKYQFRRDEWEFRGVYYLDRASAVLNGILSATISGFHYVFDIKTWRLYIYEVGEPCPGEPPHIRHALPLPE